MAYTLTVSSDTRLAFQLFPTPGIRTVLKLVNVDAERKWVERRRTETEVAEEDEMDDGGQERFGALNETQHSDTHAPGITPQLSATVHARSLTHVSLVSCTRRSRRGSTASVKSCLPQPRRPCLNPQRPTQLLMSLSLPLPHPCTVSICSRRTTTSYADRLRAVYTFLGQ